MDSRAQVALCLSGGMCDCASWQEVLAGLKSYLIGPNDAAFDIHVFVHVYLFGPEHAAAFSELRAWPAVSSAHSEEWSAAMAEEVRRRNPRAAASSASERCKPLNVASMWRKIMLCHGLLAGHPCHYDLVIRSRPDLLLLGPIDLARLAQHRLALPWQSLGCRLAFDQLAVGLPEAMAAYCKLYECLDGYCAQELASDPDILYPERLLHHHLTTSSETPTTFDLRCALLRAGGVRADPFGKLKEAFPDAGYAELPSNL